jgi:hypothetical protein
MVLKGCSLSDWSSLNPSRFLSRKSCSHPAAEVRAQFRRVKPLSEISVAQRGWTLDVLNIVRRLVSVFATLRRDESEGRAPRDPNFSGQSGTRITRPSGEFTTADAYTFTRELEQLHPDNRHVRDKIRQQSRNAGSCVTLDYCCTSSAVAGVCRELAGFVSRNKTTFLWFNKCG